MNQIATVRAQLPALLPRLRRFARTLARHAADADDLLQIALERALHRSEQWNPQLKLESWMFGIIRNAWIDEVRSRARRADVLAPETLGANVSVAGSTEQQLTVQDAMESLPEEQCSAVALVLVAGLSYQEAADVMAIPVGTLTSRLARGRDALQKLLGD
jgi:RNA polymerase sigma-70 factor, ECF subfamily